jgi:hypothetical protein
MVATGFLCQQSLKLACVFAFLSAVAVTVAAQDVQVQSPPNPSGITPVVTLTPYLQATSTTCKSSPTVSMGYSFDTSTTTYTFDGAQSLELVVPSGQLTTGPHTINVKSWSQGNSCYTPVSVTVAASGDAVAVTAPTEGDTLYSPFTLTAAAPTCNGQTTSSMAYSTDNNGDSSPFNGGSINTAASTSGLATGWHTLRVKAWGSGGNYCETDVQFNVPPSNGITPPSTAVDLPQLEQNPPYTGNYSNCGGATDPIYNEWQTQPDCNTPGQLNNVGTTTIGYAPAVPTYAGNFSPAEWESREFSLTPAAAGGGVRWVDPAGKDDSATHFIYDIWVYFPTQTDLDNLQELEMDVNHIVNVPSNLFYELSVQCSTSAGFWQYSNYVNGQDKWENTDQPCTINSLLTPGEWYHIQIESEHGTNGATNMQYDYVAVNGNVIPLTCGGNAYTGTAQPVSNWESTIGPNFQMDGVSDGGVVNVYTDAFNIFYW